MKQCSVMGKARKVDWHCEGAGSVVAVAATTLPRHDPGVRVHEDLSHRFH